MEKCLKPIQKTEKEKVKPATQVNHHYVASRLLTLVHSEAEKNFNLNSQAALRRMLFD